MLSDAEYVTKLWQTVHPVHLQTACVLAARNDKNVHQSSESLLETFHSGFVGCDGSTFNRHVVLQRGEGRVDGDLVISLVAVWQPQVIILQFHVNIA